MTTALYVYNVGLILVLVGYIIRNEIALGWKKYRLGLSDSGPHHLLGFFKHLFLGTGGVLALTGLGVHFNVI